MQLILTFLISYMQIHKIKDSKLFVNILRIPEINTKQNLSVFNTHNLLNQYSSYNSNIQEIKSYANMYLGIPNKFSSHQQSN